jgi:hypothetical protein
MKPLVSTKCKTTFVKGVIDKKYSDKLYATLQKNIKWEEGIKSKKGFTRKAKALSPGDNTSIDNIVDEALSKITDIRYYIMGIYLNYYENEDMWTPNHSHKGTHQLVISLGESRILHVAKKEYIMESGDAIIFGSSVHGIPKSDTPKKGRISIATFMAPLVIFTIPMSVANRIAKNNTNDDSV